MNPCTCFWITLSVLCVPQIAQAQTPEPDVTTPRVRVEMRPGENAPLANSNTLPFTAYPRYYQDTSDLLVRRAEDGVPRSPNPNGSNAGITPGLAKNNYVLQTFAIRHANAIDIQSYLLRGLAYEGGTVEVMGRRDLKDVDGNPVQFVFVTAPDFMLPGITETIAHIDVPGFAFHDGTGNLDANGQPGCREYVGKHRTAGELRAILIGTELGNVGQFYFAPFADPALNTLYISENPTDIADDMAVLERFDRPPLQAEFQVTIYEVEDDAFEDDAFEDVGVDFDAFKRSMSGSFVGTETSGDGKSLTIDSLVNLDARVLADFLDFLVQRTKANVVTETKLLSINSEDNPGALSGGSKGTATATPAEFRSVRVLPYRALDRSGDFATSAAITDANLFEGIEISIQPFIGTASITAIVQVTVNSLLGFDGEQEVPNIVSRSSRSVVSLAPEAKYLLGSFVKETQVDNTSGVPLLMDIPLLGRLFRREVPVNRTSRLLVFVVPRIVDASTSVRDATGSP